MFSFLKRKKKDNENQDSQAVETQDENQQISAPDAEEKEVNQGQETDSETAKETDNTPKDEAVAEAMPLEEADSEEKTDTNPKENPVEQSTQEAADPQETDTPVEPEQQDVASTPSDDTNRSEAEESDSQTKEASEPQQEAEPTSVEESTKETAEQTMEKPAQETAIDAVSDTSSEGVNTPENSEKTTRPGFFTRLKNSLSKTRKSFTESLATLVMGRKEIDEDLLDDLEMVLLTADVGVDATDKIIQNLTEQVSRKELKDPAALIESLKQQLQAMLEPVEQPLIAEREDGPFVILMVGVNGVGKTTTIGKLAKRFQSEGKSVMLAAGDTFRAAAVEQLQTWGERNDVPVMAQKTGADSAAVIFDAIQSAKAKDIDVVIADTAGRLHTQSNLMEELKKVKRVIQKVDDTAPHEVMLVLDAGTGQNALNQAKQFHEAVELSGLVVSKLDGTAKGGIVFALADQLGVPVRFIGVGEAIDDLRPFEAKDFAEALFDQSDA